MANFTGMKKFGPFQNKGEANKIVRKLNKEPKNSKFDYLSVTKKGRKELISVPYICISNYISPLSKEVRKVMLHEMIHFDLHLRGKGHHNHGKYFDRERKRLLRFPEIRGLF